MISRRPTSPASCDAGPVGLCREVRGLGVGRAQVLSRLVPELNAVTRRPDFVLKLKRGSEVYLRHLEFEVKYRKGLALRVFEYAAALAAEYGLPVASTVIILTGPAPSSLAHEERIAGRVMCRRRIPVVRHVTLPVSWSGSSRKRSSWGRVCLPR